MLYQCGIIFKYVDKIEYEMTGEYETNFEMNRLEEI